MAEIPYFFIQGVFYQRRELLDAGFVPDEGMTALVREGVFSFMYSGVIWHAGHNKADGLVGYMQDEFGVSELRNIGMTDTELSFSKYYEKYKVLGPDKYIRYHLKRQGSVWWVGKYTWPTDPRMEAGKTRCIVTKIDFSLICEDVAEMMQNEGK